MKKVIVISTSLRAGSNSDMLAHKFAEGARASGNEVETVSLRGKEIRFCVGCLLTSSLRHPKVFVEEFGDALMPCHQHGFGVNIPV